MECGAFVTTLRQGRSDARFADLPRVEKVSDKLKEGGVVKVLEVDKQGRIRRSMKAVDEGEGVCRLPKLDVYR